MRAIATFVALFSLSSCIAMGQELSKGAAELRRAEEVRQCSLELGRSLVKLRPSAEFTSSDFGDLPKEVKTLMDSFVGWVLQKDANPHKLVRPIGAKESLGFRIAVAVDKSQDDLVEYLWTFADRAIRVVASLNGMRIIFDSNSIRGCRQSRGEPCVREMKAWVESVLKLEGEYDLLGTRVEYRVDLPWPGELSDGISFSSAPDQNIIRLPAMHEWHRRVDCFVEEGALTILIYKKAEGLMGYQDGSKWFPEEFRQLIRERMGTGQE